MAVLTMMSAGVDCQHQLWFSRVASLDAHRIAAWLCLTHLVKGTGNSNSNVSGWALMSRPQVTVCASLVNIVSAKVLHTQVEGAQEHSKGMEREEAQLSNARLPMSKDML